MLFRSQRFGKSWGYDWTPRLHKERLNEPLLMKVPRLIFVPSMGDLYTPSNSDETVCAVLNAMAETYWHRFELQTKFAKRLPEWVYSQNVWLGVSLCYERDLDRLDYLRDTNARIKYAYCEPLLEEFEPDFTDIDWVVIGAKTGAHPFQPDFFWVRNLTLLAHEAGARVYHKPNLQFVKLGGPPPQMKQFPDEEWFKSRVETNSLSDGASSGLALGVTEMVPEEEAPTNPKQTKRTRDGNPGRETTPESYSGETGAGPGFPTKSKDMKHAEDR